jgi:hypothetical protein
MKAQEVFHIDADPGMASTQSPKIAPIDFNGIKNV